MDYIPTNLNTSAGITSWTNKAGDIANKNQTAHSDDLIIRQTPSGTHYSIKRKHKHSWLGVVDKGEFDPDKGYTINNDIRVMPNETYTDSNGDEVVASWGAWRCDVSFPASNLSDLIDPLDIPEAQKKKYRRIDGVNYAPIWPEPAELATIDNPNGRYWKLIGTLPVAMNICTDQGTQTYYIGAILSGSVST